MAETEDESDVLEFYNIEKIILYNHPGLIPYFCRKLARHVPDAVLTATGRQPKSPSHPDDARI